MTRWLLCATAITAVGSGFTRAQMPPPAALANTSTVPTPGAQSVRAAAPDDAVVLLMRTAGQPDRKVKILKRSAFSDGEVLLDVQDINTGQTFTLPGRVADRLPRTTLAAVTNAGPPAAQFASGLVPTTQPPTTQTAMTQAEPPAPPSFNPLNRITPGTEPQSPTANYAPPPAYAVTPPPAQVPVTNPAANVAAGQPTPGTLPPPPVAAVPGLANLPTLPAPTLPVAHVPVAPGAYVPTHPAAANPVATTTPDGVDWKPIESASNTIPSPTVVSPTRTPGLVTIPSASEQPLVGQPGMSGPKPTPLPSASEDRWKPILPTTPPVPGSTMAPAMPAPAPAQPMLTPVPSPTVPKAPTEGNGITVRGQMPPEQVKTPVQTPQVTRYTQRPASGVPLEPQGGFVRLIGPKPTTPPPQEESLANVPIMPSMVDTQQNWDDPLAQIVRQEMQPFERTLTTALRPSLRVMAARDLSELRYAARREVKMVLMRGAMTDPAPVVQAECVRSLAKLGFADTEYLAFLTSVAKEGPDLLRLAAADSLRALRRRD